MREKLETLSLTTLKDLAKQEGIKGISGPFYDPFCFFNVQILVKIVLYIPGI